jgi:hypothetical protein
MLAVTTVPFGIGLLVGMGSFAAMTWFLVRESRRPLSWARASGSRHHRLEPRVSHTRLATVCVLFTLWSLWATARPVSGWR